MAAPLSKIELSEDANLKSYYPFNTSLVTDAVGGVTLTNNNTIASGTGKFGNSASAGSTNTNKSLTVDNGMGLTAGGACSFSFWVKINTAPSSGTYALLMSINATNPGYARYFRYIDTGGTKSLHFFTAGAASVDVSSDQDLGTTDYHHICGVDDGSKMYLYLDGSILNSGGTTRDTGTGDWTGFQKFALFQLGNASQYSPVEIDDVAIFDKALSSTEVGNIYNGIPLLPTGGSLFFSQI